MLKKMMSVSEEQILKPTPKENKMLSKLLTAKNLIDKESQRQLMQANISQQEMDALKSRLKDVMATSIKAAQEQQIVQETPVQKKPV